MKLVLTKVIILCSLLLVSPTAAAEAETAGNSKNPTAVKEVLSGKRTVANAAWWGFDHKDSTDALQEAIDSGASKVIVPYVGKPWIVRPIRLASNQEIFFEEGVIVEAISNKVKPNSFVIYFPKSVWHTKENEYKRGDALFRATCKSNIILKGYGAVLRMKKKEYTAERNTSEHRHIINLRSCSNVTIEGLTLKDSGGDGIFIGRYHQYPGVKYYCENILIKDVTCDNNLRNGISVITVDGLIIENCVLKNTVGTWPQAGIVFEPNWETERLKNIIVRNTTLMNNRSLGLIVSIRNLKSKSTDVDMIFENLHITDIKGKKPTAYAAIMVTHSGCDNGTDGLIKFKNVTIENMENGARIEKSKNSPLVSFENCVWKNIMRESPIIIQTKKKEKHNVKYSGGVEFINCQVFDNKNRPAIKASGEIRRGGDDLYEIHGDLYVQNPNRIGDLYDWNGAVLHNVDITVHSGLANIDINNTDIEDPNL
jgi:hypothetical protein